MTKEEFKKEFGRDPVSNEHEYIAANVPALKLVGPEGEALAQNPPDAVLWDKNAPSGPPTPLVRAVPDWFKPVLSWLEQRVKDEGLVLDLCLERAIAIVEFNHNRGVAGIDYFPEATGGMTMTRTQLVALSVPMATELYKQVLASVEESKDEFKKLVADALAKAKADEGRVASQ